MVSPIADGVVPWPAEDVERYVAAGYWEGRSLPSHIWEQAGRTPDKVALVDGDLRLTYAELTARADSAATALTDLGLRSDDRIVVQLPNGWEFVVLTLACFRAGIVPVMALPGHRHARAVLPGRARRGRGDRRTRCSPRLRPSGARTRLADEAESLDHVLVVGEDLTEGSVDLRALCSGTDAWQGAEPDSRSVAVFLLSGGTTGLPKLIARTHDDYAYNAKRSAAVSGMDASTVYLVACRPDTTSRSPAPVFWAHCSSAGRS